MATGNTLLDELEIESRRELDMSRSLLRTNLIESVAWHTEQAFEKAMMYGYGRFRIEILGASTSAVADRIRHDKHPEKHHVIINLLHEIFSSLGGSVGAAASRPQFLNLPMELEPEVQKFA